MVRKKYGQNIAFMMEFVRKFIAEESSRFAFTLDFNHHLIQRFDKMYSENAEAAEIFAERIGEIVDNSDDLRACLHKLKIDVTEFVNWKLYIYFPGKKS